MASKQEIIELIFKSIEEINLQNDTNIPKNIDTRLFGRESELDSLGLVNLITNIEEGIENVTGNYIPIADERAFSMESSPFKTVETLADYIEILLND